MLWRWRILEHYFTSRVRKPISVTVDPSNLCSLKCPHCSTGNGETNDIKQFMTKSTFRRILDRIRFARRIHLYNWGEPLQNPQILEFIQMAKERGMHLTLHSHFSMPKRSEFFDALALSKLDSLVVSIDGATPETYQKYRIRGNFSIAVENIKRTTEAKQRHKTNKPQITWKMLINKFNEYEVEKASLMAKAVGAKFCAWPFSVDSSPDFPAEDSLEKRKAD